MTSEEHSTGLAHRLNFYRSVLITGSGSTFNIAFLFLETMIAVRLLSTDSYGTYVLLVATVNFFVIVVDLGFKTALTQLIASSDKIEQSALANSALVFRLVVITIISILIWFGKDLLIVLDSSRSLLHYAGYVPLMLVVVSLDELFFSMLQGFRVYRHVAASQIIRSVLRLSLTFYFLSVLRLGVMALIYSWIFSFAVSAAYQYLALPISKRFIYQRPLLGEILRFGFPLQLTRFLWFTFRRVDILLLGTLAGPASVAYYAIATRIPDALQNLGEAYTTVYFPTMTALLSEGKDHQARWLLNHSLRLISFVAALLALFSVLFSQQIITLLFSEKYAASTLAFSLLMIALHMSLMVNLMGYTLTSAGYPGRSLGENVTRTTLNFLSDLLLIPAFGFLGAAYAALVSRYTANPIAVWLLRRSGIRVLVTPYAKQTLLMLLCVALFWWIQPAAFGYKVAILFLFVALNVMLSTITREDLSMILPERLVRRISMSKETLPHG